MTQIAADLLCIGCGYNLRHARSEGVCSECGTAIEKSIEADQLNRADVRWLAKLALGTRFILNAAAVLAVALILFKLPLRLGSDKWFNILGGAGFGMLEGLGDWMVMSPEKRWNAKLMLVRGLILFFLLGIGVSTASELSAATGHPWPRSIWLIRISQIALAAIVIARGSVFLRGREIARRGFAPSLRWQCAAMVVVQILLVPALLTEFFASGRTVKLSTGMAQSLDYILQGGFLVTVTWGTAVVWMMRRCVLRATAIQ